MTGFVFWMLVASALGFVKALGLAALMAQADFGDYGARFGLATFAAQVVSLGLIERTIKAYPRRWAEGNLAWVAQDTRATVLVLGRRFGVILAAGAAVDVALRVSGLLSLTLLEVILVITLAFASSWLNLLASVFRAVGSAVQLQRFQLQRTSMALVFALTGGALAGWRGALAGDVTASAVSILWSHVRLRGVYQSHRNAPAVSLPDERPDHGHRALYAANMLSAATLQTDKAVVREAGGPELAGSYNVVMLLPTIAQMLVNVIVQYIGPLIIKFAHVRHEDRSRVSNLGLQAGLLAAFAGMLVAGVMALRWLPVSGPFLARYELSALAITLAGVLAAAQIFSVIEFHLIARDRESDILTASMMSTAVFFGLYGVAAWAGLGLLAFLSAGIVARAVQIALLMRAHRWARRSAETPG
jgi:hypothetical protein